MAKNILVNIPIKRNLCLLSSLCECVCMRECVCENMKPKGGCFELLCKE